MSKCPKRHFWFFVLTGRIWVFHSILSQILLLFLYHKKHICYAIFKLLGSSSIFPSCSKEFVPYDYMIQSSAWAVHVVEFCTPTQTDSRTVCPISDSSPRLVISFLHIAPPRGFRTHPGFILFSTCCLKALAKEHHLIVENDPDKNKISL